MVFSIQRDRGSSKGIGRMLKTFHYHIWEFNSFIRLGGLSPRDQMEEMIYDFVASGTWFSCEQVVSEDTPALEWNFGFSFPPYSMIEKINFKHGPNIAHKAHS